MATLADVAKKAEVSVSTVSKVLNRDPSLRITPETRDRVLAALGELKYVPHHAGRSLRLARTHSLALIVPDITNPVYAEMIRGVEHDASRLEYSIVLGRSEWFTANPSALERLLQERRVDGLLFARVETSTDDDVRRLLQGQIPTVLLNTVHPSLPGSVVLDDVAAAELATKHLIGLGHESIGFVAGPAGSDNATRRQTGFCAAMKAADLPYPQNRLIRIGYGPAAGAEGLRLLLERSITAVFVANINAAVGALTAAREVGLQVPDDMSVVGLHDSWLADHTSPPLTTVKTPLFEMGQSGVQVLLQRLAGGSPQDVVVSTPSPTLVLRGTTSAVAS